MADGPKAPRLSRPRDWIAGGALLVALVVAVELTLGWGPLLAPWAQLHLGELVAVLVLSLVSYLLRALRVYGYLSVRHPVPFPALLKLSILHNVANNLLPMRTGEAVFPWLMKRWFGLGLLEAGAGLLWIRLLDLHFLGLVGLAVLYLRAPSPGWLVAAALWLAALGLVGRVRLPRVRLAPGRVADLLARLDATAPGTIGCVLRIYVWTVLSWSSKLLAFTLLLGHFLPIAPWLLLLGVVGAELSSVLPFHGIAGSGSYELAVVAALVPLGVTPTAALQGAVNLHIFLLGVTLLLGALSLLLPLPAVSSMRDGPTRHRQPHRAPPP